MLQVPNCRLAKWDQFRTPIHMDNYAARKHGAVLEWLAERRCWIFHCTPTSCPWMKAVESFFGKPARRRLRRGVYKSVEQLEKAIMEFIELQRKRGEGVQMDGKPGAVHRRPPKRDASDLNMPPARRRAAALLRLRRLGTDRGRKRGARPSSGRKSRHQT